MTRRPTAWLILSVVCAILFGARAGGAVDRNFVGSAQADYFAVPTAPNWNPNTGADATSPSTLSAFNGFTLEAALKLSVDINEHIFAGVKVCYGCHGFEADMAYVDFRVADELNVRIGRFSPSFGQFNLRHDVANHKLSDKPLPYDMGRMLRKSDWNLGVLPSPFPDNGVEVNGSHWLGEAVQLYYAAYAVQGFRNTLANPIDLDFAQSHFPFYDFVDDNAQPTFGGRAALTFKLSDASDLTVGASGMRGTYDPSDKLSYEIVGGDVSLRAGQTMVYMEYLARRTQMDTSNPLVFKYAVPATGGDFFVKHGGYIEVEQPVTRSVDLILRGDGLYRTGNVAAASTLSNTSWVLRETAGLAWTLHRNYRVKGSVEFWQFRDPDVNGQRAAVGIHLAGVASF